MEKFMTTFLLFIIFFLIIHRLVSELLYRIGDDAEPISVSTTAPQRLDMLQDYYLKYLVEDPIDGTNLDCDVTDMIKELKEKYKNAP